MEEIRGQRVYSKYTAELPQGVEEQLNQGITAESVQMVNGRGEQIRAWRLVCDGFPFVLWFCSK